MRHSSLHGKTFLTIATFSLHLLLFLRANVIPFQTLTETFEVTWVQSVTAFQGDPSQCSIFFCLRGQPVTDSEFPAFAGVGLLYKSRVRCAVQKLRLK